MVIKTLFCLKLKRVAFIFYSGFRRASYPCYYDPFDPDFVVINYNPDKTLIELIFFATIPGGIMIVSCMYMCLCSRFIHTSDDGHMRLRFAIFIFLIEQLVQKYSYVSPGYKNLRSHDLKLVILSSFNTRKIKFQVLWKVCHWNWKCSQVGSTKKEETHDNKSG